jgi:hypothetical protein
MSDPRTKAMIWWNNLPILEKTFFAQKHCARSMDSLTGREIECIWIDEIGLPELEKNSGSEYGYD